MKRLLFTAAMLLLCTEGFCYDWKSQTNEELRADMLEFCGTFRKDARGTKAGRMVRRFARKQKKLALTEPYAWIDATIGLVTSLEEICPPVADDGSKAALIRRDMFLLLDFPLHVDNYRKDCPEGARDAFKAATAAYLADARAKTLEFIDGPAPEPGTLAICKSYNMGIVVRTSERTFLLDLRWDGTAEEAAHIAGKSDVFFLTHPHQDHYRPGILTAMLDAGKTVVMPCAAMPNFEDSRTITLEGDHPDPVEFAGIAVRTISGNQGKTIPNNVYHLSFDGWNIIDQGDNKVYDKQDMLAGFPAADVVIAPVWNKFQKLLTSAMMAEGAAENPPVYVTSHENELTHTVDHRESYRELFTREDRLGNPDFNYPPVWIFGIGETLTFSK